MTFFLAVTNIALCLVVYRQRLDLRRERIGRRREADRAKVEAEATQQIQGLRKALRIETWRQG